MDKDIFVARSGLLELAIAATCVSSCASLNRRQRSQDSLPKAANLDFLGPNVGIEAAVETIVQNRAVLVVHDVANAVPNQKPRNTQANQDADDWQDSHPLLLGILLLQPRLFDVALHYSPRVEVELGIDIISRPHGA